METQVVVNHIMRDNVVKILLHISIILKVMNLLDIKICFMIQLYLTNFKDKKN